MVRFWQRSGGIICITAILAVVLAAPATVSAQEPAAALGAVVRSGTCDAPGDVAAELTAPVVPDGPPAGPQGATPVASSYSLVPLALDALLADAFAIHVQAAGDAQTLACGEIGGARDANGALSVGLRPVGDARAGGIAYLSPADPAQTGVSLFVSEALSAAPRQANELPYDVSVRRQVTLLVGSLQRVDALVAAPRQDDRAWVDQLSAELTLWQIIYDEAATMMPPPEYAAFHGRYVEALALLDGAATDVFRALENRDRDLLARAGQKIDEAIGILRELAEPDAPATPAA